MTLQLSRIYSRFVALSAAFRTFKPAKGLSSRWEARYAQQLSFPKEIAMKRKLSFTSLGALVTFSAAILAGVIATALLSAVVLLFESRGMPMELQVAAEQACGHHLCRSQQEACMKEWLTARRATTVAKQ